MMEAFTGLPDLPALAMLKARDQWVVWGREPNRKAPINARTRGPASHSDPSTWSTYEVAAACARAQGLYVGYCMSPDDGLTGGDFDGCRDPETGTLNTFAKRLVKAGETYIEVSPSGRGLRLFALGKIDERLVDEAAGVELYRETRFLTVTGRHVPGTPTEIRAAPRSIELARDEVTWVKKLLADQTARIERLARNAVTAATVCKTPFWRNVNDAALLSLASWVPRLFGADAEPTPAGGYRVSSEALGRRLEEDLSIRPDGIKDFGVHDMGDANKGKRTAVDLVLEHADFLGVLPEGASVVDVAHWLCRQLGKTPEDFGWRPAEVPTHSKFKIERVADLAAKSQSTGPRYVVKGLLGASGVSVAYGASNSGKSFFAIDLAHHVASGRAYAGMRVTGGPAVYIFAEGSGGIPQRCAALERKHGISPDFFAIGDKIDLFDPAADTGPLLVDLAMIRSRFTLVVIDTLARAMAGGDENSARDMTAFIANVERLQVGTGAHVLIVHHAGKDASKGARGSSVLRAAVDTEIEVVPGRITVTKQRDFDKSWSADFALDVVELGKDDDGDPVTSCVFRILDHKPNASTVVAGRDLSGTERELLDAFGKCGGATGIPVRRSSIMEVLGAKTFAATEVVRKRLELLRAEGLVSNPKRAFWALNVDVATRHFEENPGSAMGKPASADGPWVGGIFASDGKSQLAA